MPALTKRGNAQLVADIGPIEAQRASTAVRLWPHSLAGKPLITLAIHFRDPGPDMGASIRPLPSRLGGHLYL